MKLLEKYNYFKTCERLTDCSGNYHIFYLLFKDTIKLNKIKDILKKNNILSSTHYIPLHMCKYHLENFDNKNLPNAEKFGKCILRLPLYYDLEFNNVDLICNIIKKYFLNKN